MGTQSFPISFSTEIFSAATTDTGEGIKSFGIVQKSTSTFTIYGESGTAARVIFIGH